VQPLWCRIFRQVHSRLILELGRFGKCALEGLYAHQLCPCQNVGKPLLQVDGLIMPGLIELCTPHPVHALVVGPAEDHGRAEPNVEVA
jgi:hypothetical protein